MDANDTVPAVLRVRHALAELFWDDLSAEVRHAAGVDRGMVAIW